MKENCAPADVKERARELVKQYAQADRNGFPSDAITALNAIKALGYEIVADVPGVVKFTYRG